MRRTRFLPSLVVLVVTIGLTLTSAHLGYAQESVTPGAGTPTLATAGPGRVGPPVILWATTIGMSPSYDQPTPAVGDGVVVTSGPTGLVAIDAMTGAERWRSAQPVSGSSPLIQGGMVYVGSGEGFKAFDVATGEERWRFLTGEAAVPDQPPDMFESSATIADDTLYVGEGAYGGLYALDPTTGEERWRFDTHGASWGSPTVADGTVYIASDALFDVDQEDPAPSALYAVDAQSGEERWHVDFGAGENSFSTPLVANGTVYVGVTNPDPNTGYFLAVDAQTGDERWRTDYERGLWDGPIVAGGDLIYLTAADNKALIAMDGATGEERWRHTNPMGVYGAPVVTDDIVYFQTNDGLLTGLDATTGAELWRMLIGGGSSAPVLADDILYAAGWGTIFALGRAGAANPVALAAQPAPPASGPGSEDTRFPAARVTKYGSEPGGYWIWEPAEWAAPDAPPAAGPFPVLMFLSGCCGNGYYPTPEEVDAWMQHLARQGYVIIAPVYKVGSPLEDSRVLLRQALDELGRPGHAGIDPTKFGVIGFSYGGMTSILYAATAEEEGLPAPSALFLTAPCTENGFCLDAPEEGVTLPAGLKAVVIGYADDHVIGTDQPKRVFAALASLPDEDRDFVFMTTDGHGLPAIYAGHDTTYNGIDAADRYAVWKLSDALFACTFQGEQCEVALGNTPEQRFMGVWSDGVPVKELEVTDNPGTQVPAATPEAGMPLATPAP
jgi:outer membrane protein assembly factor BamB/dienelactone hydrolase